MAAASDPLNRSPSQQEADARERASAVELKDAKQQLPSDAPQPTEVDRNIQNKIESQEREEEKTQETIQESETFLYCVLFFTLFGFGTLTIVAVGAIIFYLMDYFAALFDFDLSEYTAYICLALTLINMIMSCVGCWGTFRFSALKRQSEKELEKVTNDLEKVGQDLQTDNDDLRIALRELEVKITHFDGENNESIETLLAFDDREKHMQRVVKKESEKNVSLSELWTLWQIQETNEIIHKIVSITGEYYNVAYQDNDTEDGLNKEQYETLIIKNPEIRKLEREIFPSFEHTIWKREKPGDPILVDELERVCAMVYKASLEYELRLDNTLNNEVSDKQRPAFDVAKQVLQQDQQEATKKDANDEDDGFFANFKRLLSS